MKSSLREYVKKRDFNKTDEPYPKGDKRKKTKLEFVVQKHAARRLHYDLRLEMEGVLRSWAVPKEFSAGSSEKRLAIQTEDHPMDYASFEGDIPKGEYGGGHVEIWDRGYWVPDSDPVRSWKQGKLGFSLRGKRLNGHFHLVRTSRENKKGKDQWLLFSDPSETKVDLSEMEGIRSSKTWPPLQPQLAKLAKRPPRAGDWIEEVKFDGYRVLIKKDEGKVQIFTRRGHDWSDKFPHLLKEFEGIKLKQALFDGELVALNAKGLSDFQALQNQLTSGADQNLYIYLFDLLYIDGKDIRAARLLDRKKVLRSVLSKALQLVRYSEHFTEKPSAIYEAACRAQLEGIILKRAESSYVHRRSESWLKLKCEKRQEFVIGGWTDPSGSRKHLGALLLGYYENSRLKYAGKVGTGFNDKSLRDLEDRLQGLKSKASPFVDSKLPEKGSLIQWAKPQLVAEIGFAEWTSDGRLRHPRYLGLREDKPAREVKKEEAMDLEEASKSFQSLSEVKRHLTSPDKILFPEQGLTKLELASYYEAVAEYMLDFVAQRPLSLVRCPEGRAKTCFFQKHPGQGMEKDLPSVWISEKKAKRRYIYIKEAADLVRLVQYGCLELHCWGAHQDKPDRPDLVVFDLDPAENVDFSAVVETAFLMKEFLEELDLRSFVRTTGGKGLHIVFPIERRLGWDRVKAFTKAVADSFQAADPKKYISKSSLAARKGKIFIDYLRNGQGATSICLLSTRAKPGAPVSAPLEWKELKSGLNPQDFNLRTMPEICRSWKVHPWAELLGLKQNLTKRAFQKLRLED